MTLELISEKRRWALGRESPLSRSSTVRFRASPGSQQAPHRRRRAPSPVRDERGGSGRGAANWLRTAPAICLTAALVLAACRGDDDEDPEEVFQRDRSETIPKPEIAGAMPHDFDPDDMSRIVDPSAWNVSFRAAGPPGAVPTELVATIDRSIVRRGHPQIGPGTRMTVRDDAGEEIDVADISLGSNHRVFRAELARALEPGTRYEVEFERVEFVYSSGDASTEEDIEVTHLDPAPKAQFETPRFALIDLSAARPVGAFGHVELRFSAPVAARDLEAELSWALDGAAPESVHYDLGEDGRVASARLRAPGGSFADVDAVALSGGDGLVSSDGGASLTPLDESTPVGDTDGLEIRAVGTYERAGEPAIRVVCHDPTAQEVGHGYWDQELREYISDVSRRCDVDIQRVRDLVELDTGDEFSIVDHPRGFEVIPQPGAPAGTVGLAVRTGDFGDHVPELYEGHEETMVLPYAGPELAVDADGRYLERENWDRVPIRHRGVELVHVVIRHAPEETFGFWLSGGDEMGGRTSFAIADDYLELDPGPDGARYSYIDMSELVGEPEPGAYQVEVSAPYYGGVRDAHRFIVSDIQLIAKRASHTGEQVDEVWAWTIDVDGAQPVSGVALELVRENGKALASCETDGDGWCVLRGNWGDLDSEPPFAVVAEGAGELAYVDWTDTKTEIARGEIGGVAYADDPAHRGALQAERTLYRPGETMRLAGIVRDREYRGQSGVPVGVEISNARGQQAYRGVYESDEVGALEFDYRLPELATTGTWNIEMFAGDEAIARQAVSVEEFVPERIDVDLDLEDFYVSREGGLQGAVRAEYLFGAAASGADFEVTCRFAPENPFAERYPEYEFGPFPDDIEPATARHEGTLDDDGRAEFSCDAFELDERVPYAARVEAAVFEAGSGTPSRQEGTTTLLPGDELIGLRSAQERVDRDDGAVVEGIVVGPAGDVETGARTADLELGAIRYTTTQVRADGRTRWERERHESVDDRAVVDLEDGRFSVRAPPRGESAGLYVRAERAGAVTELEIAPPRRFWGWGTRDLDPRPDDPAHVEIEGPSEVTVGQPAEFSFEAPAAGRALVTIETYRVDAWEWIDVEPGENTWEAEVEYFDPNVYVSALYVPTAEDAPEGLDRGFGTKRVSVARSPWNADVHLAVADEREPGDSLDVTVRSPNAGQAAKVAVAAVDRGILSIATHEATPAIEQIFATLALGVETFDTVGWYADVSPELFGGGLAPMEPSPEVIMPVEPTSMWSGLVPLDDDGRAEVSFEIPDYRGELDIAAIVIGDDRLGEASARTTVRDPLALQATAPRFATHGDEIRVPVQVTNTTQQAIDVDLAADVIPDAAQVDVETAELEIAGEDGATMSLDPDEHGRAVFDVRVAGRAGAPALAFTASGGGLRSRHEATVPIYPGGARSVEQETHTVRETFFDVSGELDGWLPTSETTDLWVTSIPRAPAFVHLERVLYYPRLRLGANLYNTVARVRPAVYLDRLLQAADPEVGERGAGWRVSSGIRGLERLQQSSGRFSFWASGTLPVSPWGQAYVLDMLTSAGDAGHAVPEWVVRDGLDWLDRRVQRGHDLKDLDLALWVLARNGRPDRRAARALLDALPRRPTGRDHERALLATASLYIAGDETVRDDLRALISRPALGHGDAETHYSPARHEGLALEVGIESFGAKDEVLADLASDVADRLADAERGELNLHELGWSVSGLGRWAEARMESIPEARLLAGGTEIEPEVVGDDGSRSWRLHRASEYGRVTLELDEESDVPVTLFRRTEGVKEGAAPVIGGEGIELSRAIRDADGEPVAPRDLEVGDLAFVDIRASHDQRGTLEDLALDARIAGGFEIENPRPEGDHRPDWLDPSEAWNVDHVEVRDNRVEAFGSIREDETVRFVYSIRATTAGRLSTPPTELRSLYQADRWARVGGEDVEIRRR